MSWKTILSEAEPVDGRNGVSYYAVDTQRVLNRVSSPRLPFDLSLNPYLNCELGCAYCYARDFSHKRQGGEGSFDREICAKRGAAEVLRRELQRLRRTERLGTPIALGTATDPYQPAERRSRVTRELLEVMAEFGGVSVAITTKSDLVLRDLDVLSDLARRGRVRVNMSVTTPDRDLARTLEPRAQTPRKRLAAVERLARAGILTGVFCMPILPNITDGSRDLRTLVYESTVEGASYFATRVLELRAGVRPAFFAWLQRERPALVARYRRRYARGANGPRDEAERIERLVSFLRRQYGIPAFVPFEAPPPCQNAQLELFGGDPAPQDPPRPTRRLPTVEAA